MSLPQHPGDKGLLLVYVHYVLACFLNTYYVHSLIPSLPYQYAHSLSLLFRLLVNYTVLSRHNGGTQE
jgi:hypothetical protein